MIWIDKLLHEITDTGHCITTCYDEPQVYSKEAWEGQYSLTPASFRND